MVNNLIKNIYIFSLVSLLFGQSPDQVLNDGKAQLANGDYEQAEILFKKALEMDPTFSPALLELARINLRFGKMKDTQELLRQAIDIDPENKEYRGDLDE
jgi:Tfp pilus assembly protein PilF